MVKAYYWFIEFFMIDGCSSFSFMKLMPVEFFHAYSHVHELSQQNYTVQQDGQN